MSLRNSALGKREAPDVPPSPRAVAPTVLEPRGGDDADLSDVDARQEAEEAAKFYKDEWRKLKIQVNEQNKAIAELKAALGKGDEGGKPDPMWQGHGDAWSQWKKAQPPGLPESLTEELPNEYDQYHSYNQTQNWSGKWYHQEWRGRYYDDQNYRGPKGYIDKKDLVKPETYSGDISKWLAWQGTFVRYMSRIDRKWLEILKAIEKKKGQVISKEDEEQLEWDLYMRDIDDWKEQLMLALESFTSGEAKRLVLSNTESNVFSTWSRLADNGHSMRDKHVMGMRRKLNIPRSSVPTKDLEIAIINYEKEIQMYEDASGETFSPIDKVLTLKEIFPAPLRQRVEDLKGNGRFETYEQIRAEALIWIADSPPVSRGRLAMATEAAEEFETEIPDDKIDEFFEDPAKFLPADTSSETIFAIVRKTHLKKQKGTGKGKGGSKGPRKCYECDGEGHIAADCPVRAERVAAGGPERLDDPMGVGKSKGKGKNKTDKDKKGETGKGGGKVGKGVWTPAGDHGGFWVPTRHQIIESGGFPYPTQYQYNHPWHVGAKGAQPGAKMILSNGSETADHGVWMQAPGYAMRLQQVSPKAHIEVSNSFAALASNEQDSGDLPKPPAAATAAAKAGILEHCTTIAQQVASAPRKAGKAPKCCEVSRRCSGCDNHTRGCDSQLEWELPETKTRSEPVKPSARTFLEKRSQSLRPLASGWEKFQAILDSGASVTVIPPHLGRDYEIVKGEAAMAGVRYEIADGNEIPNLGEKLMPVMTREGTWKGLKAEVADISKALQSVRSLVKTGHKVVFGGGENGNEHYIENVFTGEINAVEDDGQNYLMTYLIAPRDPSASFAGPTR